MGAVMLYEKVLKQVQPLQQDIASRDYKQSLAFTSTEEFCICKCVADATLHVHRISQSFSLKFYNTCKKFQRCS